MVAISRTSDLRSRGREFEPRPAHGCITTVGKLFAPMHPWYWESQDVNRHTPQCTSPILICSCSISWCLAEGYSRSALHCGSLCLRKDFTFYTTEPGKN